MHITYTVLHPRNSRFKSVIKSGKIICISQHNVKRCVSDKFVMSYLTSYKVSMQSVWQGCDRVCIMTEWDTLKLRLKQRLKHMSTSTVCIIINTDEVNRNLDTDHQGLCVDHVWSVVLSTHSHDFFFRIVVHQPASLSIWPAVHSYRRGLSINPNPGVTMWVQLKIWCVLCIWVLQGGNIGDGCDFASTCVSMIWGTGIYLFWDVPGCDEWGGEVSLKSC